MSMPSFPKNGADLTREQALTMIIASIAMEECALSRIMEAEGEKLRCILDKLDPPCGEQKILEVNCSISKLLDMVAQNQLILRSKLALALEAGGDCCLPCPPCPPKPCRPPCPPKPCPPPPCPERPCLPQRSTAQLEAAEYFWRSGTALPLAHCRCRGGDICWDPQSPAVIRLNPQKAYQLSYIFTLRDFLPVESTGRICLSLDPEGAYPEQPPLWFSVRCPGGEPTTLQYTAFLFPSRGKPAPAELSLRLCTRGGLCVEQAVLSILEL